MSASKSHASRPCVPDPALGSGGAQAHWLRAVVGAIAAGLLLAGCHERFDLSVGLPGHFGIIWMAGVMFVRLSSPLAFTAALTTLGYAAGGTGLDLVGGRGPWHAVTHLPVYLVPALIVDFAARPFSVDPQDHLRPMPAWRAALVGGVAFASKPLALAAGVTAFGMTAGALRHGIAFPVLTHFAFGAIGAVIGCLIRMTLEEAQRPPGSQR